MRGHMADHHCFLFKIYNKTITDIFRSYYEYSNKKCRTELRFTVYFLSYNSLLSYFLIMLLNIIL